MQDIKTTNLISTPNIEGNIGSCKTESVKELTYGGVFVQKYQVIMTNSCTGSVVREYEYSDYSHTVGFTLFTVLMVALAFAVIRAIRLDRSY